MDAAPAPAAATTSLPDAASAGDVGADAGAVVPEEAAATPTPTPPEPHTVTIHGEKVSLAELQKHFDPGCKSCVEGVVMVGRPLPRGFKGVIRVPELCDCTVRGYVAAHPAPAGEPELGRRARAALAGAPPPRNDAAEKQAARLRVAIDRQRADLAEAESHLSGETAAIDDEQRHNAERMRMLEEARAAAARSLEALRARVSGVQAEIAGHDEAIANRQTLERSITERRRQVEAKQAGQMKRVTNLRAEIEKLERRLTLALARHGTPVGYEAHADG